MSYTIVASICEGHFDCVSLCPAECIYEVRTREGKAALVDNTRCTDCGACHSVCPIEGAIVAAWRPELQVNVPPGARLDPLFRRYELPNR